MNALPRRTRFSYTMRWISSRTRSDISKTRARSSAASAPSVSVRMGSPNSIRHFDGSGIAERAEERERRGDREVRGAERARHETRLADLGIDLLAAHDRDRDDRRAGAHRDLDETAAAEPLQAVALGEVLAGALGPFGEDRHELVLLEQARSVVGRRDDAADLAHGDRYERQRERPVEHQEAREPRQRVLALDRERDHR